MAAAVHERRRFRQRAAWTPVPAALLALTALLLTVGVSQQQQQPQPQPDERCSLQRSVWLSELRASEAGLHLELTALAGLNLASWALVVYDSRAGSCGSCLPTEVFLVTRTTVVPDEGASGLGTLHLVTSASFGETVDAVALLDGVSGAVVELISWGGEPFLASDGPAQGSWSCSVAGAATAQVLQATSADETMSLQLQADAGSWVVAEATFGHLNSNMVKPVVGRVVDLTSRAVWINEVEYYTDASGDNLRVEIAGIAGTSLAGWWLEYLLRSIFMST